jgi:hypothetical protein
LVFHEGERNRIVTVVFEAVDQPSTPPSAGRRWPWPVFALGGLGAIAFGTSVYLDASGVSDVHNLRGSCAPRCPHGDVQSAHRTILAGDLLLGTGIIAIGVAAWMALAASHRGSAMGPRGSRRSGLELP